jgi:hypothetical protein
MAARAPGTDIDPDQLRQASSPPAMAAISTRHYS